MQYDCLSCGACCYGPEEYVAVSGPDRDRMDRRSASRYVVHSGGRLYLKMVNGHCAALHARQGHYSCRIYGIRPTVCHVVEPGSRECLVARRRRGVE
jgi:Fe-S-cluster containining protein